MTVYSDAARTQVKQTVSGNIDLQSTTAIALFGAVGGNTGVNRFGGVTQYTVTSVAVPIKIHYVDANGNPVADVNGDGQVTADDVDTVYVNVRSTLNIDNVTDVAIQTFAPRTVSDTDGNVYSFVGTRMGTGSNYVAASAADPASLTVQNPDVTADAVTDITVYYAPADTSRTIEFTSADGTTSDLKPVTQSSYGETSVDNGGDISAYEVPVQDGYVAMIKNSDGSYTKIENNQIPAAQLSGDTMVNVVYVLSAVKPQDA